MDVKEKKPTITKNASVQFRCSAVLRDKIEKRSIEQGKSISEYLSDLVKRDLEKGSK